MKPNFAVMMNWIKSVRVNRKANPLIRLGMFVAFLLLLVTNLSGCASLSEFVRNGFKVGPGYAVPASSTTPQWIDIADKRVRSDTDDLSQWWNVFNDPVLDDLVKDAYRQNLTLREAGQRVLQARADYDVTVGGILPQSQTMTGGFNRDATSIAALLGGSFGSFASGGGGTPAIKRYFNQANFNFGLAWELDFWGRFRRAIEASSADLDASVANYNDVLVTLLSDVASNYVQYRVLEEQIELLNKNVVAQKEVLNVAQKRFDAGAKDSEFDLPQAKTTVHQTLAQIPQTEIRLRARANRLCVLLGMSPQDLQARLGKGAVPKSPQEVAAGIPADLLRRRPDIRRAERQAAAESARIGVAVAQLYPHISITGTLGWSGPKISQLFTPPAFQGNFGPSFQWDVLNYGRNLNKVRSQKAHFEQVVSAYQNKVLGAAEEVENGITTYLKSKDQADLLKISVEEAQKARKVGKAQYDGGKIDPIRLAVLELNLVQQETLWAQAKGDVALGLIQVYRALGGGWQIEDDSRRGIVQRPTQLRPIRGHSMRPLLAGPLPERNDEVSSGLADFQPLPRGEFGMPRAVAPTEK